MLQGRGPKTCQNDLRRNYRYLSYGDLPYVQLNGELRYRRVIVISYSFIFKSCHIFAVYDASFRIPQGILKGNFVGMGNFHQCLGIKQDEEDVPIEGKYCMVQSLVWNPIPSLSATSWMENKEWMTMSTNATSKQLDNYKNSRSIGNKLIEQNRYNNILLNFRKLTPSKFIAI